MTKFSNSTTKNTTKYFRLQGSGLPYQSKLREGSRNPLGERRVFVVA